MFNLFNKGPKVRAGKQNNEPEKPAAAAAGKKPLKLGGLSSAFKKLNSMDRKQAYTWGAVAVVAMVALLMLGSMAGSSDEDDFSGYETRGYDLANMPFSADEAEQYLLASKYPDMKDKNAPGLYSKEEKAARQEADAENQAEEQAKAESAASSKASQYVPGRYYGGGKSGSGQQTRVGTLNSANLKGSSGSGISGTFGPKGDFSNFRSQNKGNDKFSAQPAGKMNARQALFQTAKASRAAAGLKNDKLLNAKKAMMGGDVKGGDAFANESGAVNIGAADGLELDTNAPISSADLSGLDDGLNDANDDAANDASNQEETEWWQEMLQDMAKQMVQGLLTMGMNATQDAIADAKASRDAEAAQWQNEIEGKGIPSEIKGDVKVDILGDNTRMSGIMEQKNLHYNDDRTQILDSSNNLIASQSPGNEAWQYAEGQTISLSEKDARHINENRVNQYWQNHPVEYNDASARVKAAGYNARSGGSSRSSWGDPYRNSDQIKVNGVTVFGTVNDRDGTFKAGDGRTYKRQSDGTWIRE